MFVARRRDRPAEWSALAAIWLMAGENLNQRDVVYISADNTVKKADSTKRMQTIGVVAVTTAQGNLAKILFGGKAEVVADGAINAGDPVAAAPTAGRVVSLTSYTPSGSVSGSGHDHEMTSGTMDDCGDVEYKYVVGNGYLIKIKSSGQSTLKTFSAAPSLSFSGAAVQVARIFAKAVTASKQAGDVIQILIGLGG